ncbi:MAG: glycerol-3-phosphate acyltransferase [Acidimicrobiaceae bacterium]|nr:glycerol-3-phosphate acyltransferase [Acidimicrobiaceae bacterium]
MIWLLLVPAYLLGTFPSAVMVARSKGIDIHEVGSGNPGASNVARTMGTKWGVFVFFLDGLKGAIPAAVALMFTERPSPAAYAMTGAAVVGHMYPITRRFKGGKGSPRWAVPLWCCSRCCSSSSPACGWRCASSPARPRWPRCASWPACRSAWPCCAARGGRSPPPQRWECWC